MGNDVEYVLRIVLRARDEMVAVFAKARAELKGFTSDVKKFDESLGGLNSKITSLNRRIGNVDDKFKQWRTTLHGFSGDGDDADDTLKRLDSILDRVGGTSRNTQREAEAYRRTLRSTSSDTRSITRETEKQKGALDRLRAAFRGSSSSAASFGNEMRGIAIVFGAAFAQQLITSLIGLGGELVAVASSAVMAGGAIGGILAAGIAQAVPVAGLLAGALFRVKAVMDAVQQATKLQQAQSVASFEAGRKQADATDQIANALDGVRNATQGVTDAQDSLTQAQRQQGVAQENLRTVRKQAERDLRDMILTEKEADLAARGAALSQKDAQEALQVAIRTGGDVAQAQLRVQEANLAATRARREAARQHADVPRAERGGVEGTPEVQSARRQADDAARGVARAAQAVGDAERAVTRAQRGLETARRNANEAVTGTQTAAANLNYLLSQLSPAERKLYEAVRRVQSTWKTAWTGAGGIIEPIIESFSGGVDRINTLMKMPSVLRTARSLSTEIGKQFSDITDTFTSEPIVAQINRIATQSKRNLGPVTGIVEDLGQAFLNIAEDAGPAFRRFLGYVGGLADKFLDLTKDHDKVKDFFNLAEENLESWINLGLAVVNIFAAITGAGGAAEGKKGIDDLTGSLNDMAGKIRDSSDDVGKFFSDARDVFDQVLSVIKTLGTELAKTFSPTHTQHFADLLNNIVIPALGDTIRITSTLTDLIAQLLDTPVVGEIAKWGLTFAALSFVGGSTLKTFGKFGDMIGGVVKGAKAVGPELVTAGGKMSEFGKQFDIPRAQATRTGSLIGGTFTRLGPIVTKAGGAIRAASAFAFGPWGLAILAVIAAIVLLDRKFHFLGPTLRWLKGAFGDVLDWLKTHWPLVLTILTGPFGLAVTLIVKNWNTIKRAFTGAFNFIKDKITGFSDFVLDELRKLGHKIVSILPNPFRKAGKGAADGLIDGIKGIGRFFADIGKWLFAHVIKPIYDFFEIKSPSGYFKRIGRMLVDGFVDGFRSLPGMLVNALKTMGDQLMDIGKQIGEWIHKGLEKIPGGKLILGAAGKVKSLLHLAGGGPVPGSGRGDTVSALLEPGEHVLTKLEVAAAGGHAAIFALRALLGGGGQGSGGRFQTGGRVAGAGSLTIGFEGGNLDDFKSEWRQFWLVLLRSARSGTGGIENEFRQMRVNTSRSVDRMYRDVRGSIADIQRSFIVRSKDLTDNWRGAWQKLSKLAYDGLSYIGHEANRALTGFGAHAINFGLSTPAVSRQRGGMIPGWGDGDHVPVLAEPGEGFINKRAVRALGGPGVIDAINSMIPRFATGGVVGSHIRRLVAAANKVSNLNLPYVWGGGHSQPAQIGSGMDCSGSVSYAVQQAGYKVPTTTSGNIGSWGFPRGGDGASIFYNPIHTFMKIGSRFWGTSGFARPNGGAGWFTSAPGAGYLSQFQQVHLPGINNVGAFSTAAGEQLAKLMVRGPSKGFKSMFQHIFDKVVGAGNDFIATKDSALDPIASGDPGEGSPAPPGQHRNWIRTALRLAGIPVSDPNVNAQYRLDMGESSGNPRAVQRIQDINSVTGNLARGIAQVIPPTFRSYMLSGHGNIFSPIDNIIASVRYQMAKYGHLVGHPGYAKGGVVPGGDGMPVPITAHAGEWVLNKVQQARLAGLTGLGRNTLRGMLGFHGGKGSFQGGGEVEAVTRGPLSGFHLKPIVSEQLQDAFVELRRLTDKLARDLRRGSVGRFIDNLDQVLDDLNIASRRMRGASRADRRRGVDGFLKVVDNLFAEGGLFAKLRTAIEAGQARAARTLSRQRFFVGAGRQVFERQGAVGQATGALEEERRLRGDLLGEQTAAGRALALIRRQQRRGGLTQQQRQRLAGQATAAEAALSEAQQRVADNVAAIFEAQQALLTARLEAQQKIVDNITRGAERTETFRDFARRVATVFGNEGAVAQLAAASRNTLADEANQLEAQIAGFRNIGTEEANQAADQLEEKVADLRTQLVESLAQELTDAASRIQEHAQRRSGRLDLFGRLLTATGVVGRTAAVSLGGETFSAAGIAQQQQANTLNQIAQTQDLLNRVQREQPENVKLIQDLTDNLAELSVTLQEQQRAAFQARVEDVNSRSDFTLGINDLNKQILDLTGQISGNADQTGLLKLANERQAILTAKGNELQALYNEAVSQQDQQAINDLQTALLTNQVAMLQNTQAINELTGASKDPQTFASSAWTQFREAIFTGMGQILPQFDFSPMGTDVMNVAGAGVGTSSSVSTTTGGDTNITVNEAGGPVDTTEIAAAVAFARKAYQ